MNKKAAVFACKFTGVTGLAASLFLWKVSGFGAMIAGLIGSLFWFGLAWWFNRSDNPST